MQNNVEEVIVDIRHAISKISEAVFKHNDYATADWLVNVSRKLDILSSLLTPEKDGDVADIKKEFANYMGVDKITKSSALEEMFKFFIPYLKQTADAKRDGLRRFIDLCKKVNHEDIVLQDSYKAYADMIISKAYQQYLLESERGKE